MRGRAPVHNGRMARMTKKQRQQRDARNNKRGRIKIGEKK